MGVSAFFMLMLHSRHIASYFLFRAILLPLGPGYFRDLRTHQRLFDVSLRPVCFVCLLRPHLSSFPWALISLYLDTWLLPPASSSDGVAHLNSLFQL